MNSTLEDTPKQPPWIQMPNTTQLQELMSGEKREIHGVGFSDAECASLRRDKDSILSFFQNSSSDSLKNLKEKLNETGNKREPKRDALLKLCDIYLSDS